MRKSKQQISGKWHTQQVKQNENSKISDFISGKENVVVRARIDPDSIFDKGSIDMNTVAVHTVKPLEVHIPRGRLTTVTGMSGAGKTTLILECLIPGLEASINKTKLSNTIKHIEATGINRVNLIDATPIGVNVRSTVATYSNVLDDLRKLFSSTPDAKAKGYNAQLSHITQGLYVVRPVMEQVGSLSMSSSYQMLISHVQIVEDRGIIKMPFRFIIAIRIKRSPYQN